MDLIPYRLFFYCATVGGGETVRTCRQMFMFEYNLSIFLTSTDLIKDNKREADSLPYK